jgi:hypothetical protein
MSGYSTAVTLFCGAPACCASPLLTRAPTAMSTIGVVQRWHGTYGFAITDAGETAYIHSGAIGGGMLEVGGKVHFDVEHVAGHQL